MSIVLKAEGIIKKFREVYALKNINFELREGEIHGIVGANGSGKSTFLNILFGDAVINSSGGFKGNVYIEGNLVNINNSKAAIKAGIGMVHQEFALINDMDVASNVKLTRENIYTPTAILSEEFSYVDKRNNYFQTEKIMDELGIEVDINTKVNNLPVGLKQFVEIARELDKQNLKVLMLDEPTASLNKEASKALINVLKKISEKGTSIIFISHRLDEVIELCDKVSVFRDGEIVSSYKKEEFNIEKISTDMIGQSVVKVDKKKNTIKSKEKVLSFNNVFVKDGHRVYKDISLDIYKGEILGITSLAGHGQSIFSYGIMGLYEMDGDVIYKDEKLNLKNTQSIIKKGIVMLPEDRKELGLLLQDSIEDNIIFTACHSKNKFVNKHIFKSLAFLDKKKIAICAEKYVTEFNIKCSSKRQLVKELSGGNQQKVCMARALATEPEVLFIGEPTRGIDVYSKELILKMLVDINDVNETTIVVASSEVEELKRVCDRIVVMYEGKIFDIFSPEEDDEVLSMAISGKRREVNREN